VNTLTPKERDVAMVFQNYALYPHLSVYENIAFGLRLRKEHKDEIHRRVTWAGQLLDLTPYLDRKPKQLSGGQRQRVAMGRAIVRQPQVFLMDEPLSNLDARLRVQMRADIAKLQHDLGTTTIYVTHDQVEAMTMGDRVAVMRNGVLQQVAAPQTLYDTPANMFVAGFIGTPAMNLLEADVEVNSGVSVSFGGATFPVPDEALAAYPGVRGYGGRRVVAGLRSQHFHPASERPELPTLMGEVELVEALGGESIVHFKIDAFAIRPAHHEELGEVPVSDEGVVAARPNLVAQFPSHVTLQISENVPIAVEAARLHFFEGDTGEPLR
jgi:multiple sugar transport system ATP-binding protein